MLFRPAGESRSARIQGAFIAEDEIERLTDHWRRQGEPELHEELLEAVEPEESEDSSGDFDPDQDDMLADAISTVVQMGTASTSMLQRRLRVGYTRAGRLVDMMERRGVISGYEGSKARQVLITEADLPRVLESLADAAVARLDRGLTPARGPHAREGGRGPPGEAARIGAACPPSGKRCARPGCASGSTSRTSSGRPRSARSTCARSRTRSSRCCPGPTFVKTFLRTYAELLGLDPHALRRAVPRQTTSRATSWRRSSRSARRAAGGRDRRRGGPRPWMVLALLGWRSWSGLVALGLSTDDEDRRGHEAPTHGATETTPRTERTGTETQPRAAGGAAAEWSSRIAPEHAHLRVRGHGARAPR